MSAVLDTPTLRQRKGLASYQAARATAIHHGERQALRCAESDWRADPRPLPVHRTARRRSMWQRLHASLVIEFRRRWWLALIAAVVYLASGAALGGAVIAVQAGWWTP